MEIKREPKGKGENEERREKREEIGKSFSLNVPARGHEEGAELVVHIKNQHQILSLEEGDDGREVSRQQA